MRKFSLLLIASLLCQSGLETVASEGRVELKAEQPIADSRSETKFLFARVSQIEKAQTGEKLPLRPTARAQSTRAKTDLKAKIQSPKLSTEAPAKAPEKKILTTSASQQTKKPQQELKQVVSAQNEHIKLTDVYAGQLRLIASHQFSSDPSLNIRLSPGERGFTLIRFEKSASGSVRMHPPAVFFAGRDLPASQMQEQQQRFDDPYADRRRPTVADNGNLFSWFRGAPSSTASQMHHLNYVYVPLGTIQSSNSLGHFYLQNVISTETKIVDNKSLAQDEVAEVQTNDPASHTRYYEFATHFEITGSGKAHVRIARVQYSEDRSILYSQTFEGDVTTNEVSTVQADISSYTKKSWDQISAEFRL